MTETIGQRIKQARLQNNLSIEQVVESTRIRPKFIEAIESDNFEAMSSPAQVKGFLRIYTDFLGLHLEETQMPERKDTTTDEDEKPEQGVKTDPKSSRDKSTRSKPKVPKNVPTDTGNDIDQVLPEDEKQASPSEAARLNNRSQSILGSLGTQLLQRREVLGLTREEVGRNIHIREFYIEALESGKFDLLPSSVQARGLLLNYAGFLNLDVDDMLLQYAEALQTKHMEKQLALSDAKTNGRKHKFNIKIPSNLRKYLTNDLLFGGGIFIVLTVFAILAINSIFNQQRDSSTAAIADTISDVLLITQTGEIPTSSTSVQINTAQPVSGNANNDSEVILSDIQVVVMVSERTLLKVIIDGEIAFDERVLPGDTYSFEADQQIEISTGNGAALSILFNQINLGPMGAFGESVTRIYTANEVLTPTATSTPSPTPTPQTTPAPSFTPTPVYTPTR